jgi:UrcA family protein
MTNTNTRTIRLLCAAALVGLFASAPGVASAADTYTRSAVVSLRGLDLNAPQDVATMRHRILAAANKLCNELGDDEGAAPNDDVVQSCTREAFNSALAQTRPMIAAARSRALFAAGAPPYRSQPTTIIASTTPAQR